MRDPHAERNVRGRLDSGVIIFDCGSNQAAFQPVDSAGAVVTLTPTFTLPSSYTHLYVEGLPVDHTCNLTASAQGNYNVTVAGTSESLIHSIIVPVSVLPYPDFAITVTTPLTIIFGASATANITVTSMNGFVGTVSLSDLIPSGLSCGPITPPTLNGSGIATLTCNGLPRGTTPQQ